MDVINNIMTDKNNINTVLETEKSTNIFITSDHHFGHANIIKHCNRPFKNVQEMDHILKENWNKTIKPADIVYFLGDITKSKKNSIDYWLSKLNGNILFIRGNHDKGKINRAKEIIKNIKINYRDCEFLLMHEPRRPSDYNGWILHGHIHNNEMLKYPHINKELKTINVSVELTDYTPVNLDIIIDKISDKS